MQASTFASPTKKFIGWSLTADALTADYQPNDSVNDMLKAAMVASQDGIITLYAVWKDIPVTGETTSSKPSNNTNKKTNGWDDGGPFTTDKCGNVFDRWGNKIYEANGCNVGGYNLVRTSVID